MTEIGKNSVTLLTVDEGGEGQRVDNFLARHLKGVPKSHIYRILRSGEVRVDSKRVEATHRLQIGEVLRIPPVRVAAPAAKVGVAPASRQFADAVIFEDDAMLALDKPAGMAVHGGSGISRGVIEQLRWERPQAKFLELAHRLDRETSGVLLIGKKRSALTKLHEMMRENRMRKRYLVLVNGRWQDATRRVVLPLKKYDLESGEKRVAVEAGGQHSETIFRLKQHLGAFTLLEAELITGRTHQLRVQLAHMGFPIAGDDKYGDFALNKLLQKRGLKRMFLHSAETALRHPLTDEPLKLIAPLPRDLERFLEKLKDEHAQAV
ncbi:MAG TPA: RluA family pseudouridine synthase [Novimethylophilus sp.]|jgi:23S rRNA pseudouridine955/2504/2580 synthase|uniref:RluA family pseudouridine synthase n=1 Tax=Novimethylophilus sp. TaxID=2137426 RepID=UPI002F3F4FF3